MAVPAPGAGGCRVALTAACACPLAPAVGGPLEAPSTYPPYAGARNMPPAASARCRPCSRCRCVRLRPSTIAPCRWTPRPATFGRPNPARTAPCSRPWPGPGDSAAIPAWAPLCPAMAAVTPRPATPLGCGREAPPEPPPEYALDLEAPTSPRPGDGVLRRLAALARLVFLGRRTRRSCATATRTGSTATQRPGRGGRQPEYQRPFWGSAAPVGGRRSRTGQVQAPPCRKAAPATPRRSAGSTAWTPAPVPAPSTTAPRWAAARYATA